MIVESVELKDYRNYEFLDMNFNEHVNIIYGDNAQGKTNILESIYMCSTSKSHRGSKDREIVRFGEDESHIKLNVLKHGMKYRIDMHLKKNKTKGIAVNGIPIKKAVELFGIINIVFFSPEDLNIIKNGPSERRRFMDMELSQLDKIYLSNLVTTSTPTPRNTSSSGSATDANGSTVMIPAAMVDMILLTIRL